MRIREEAQHPKTIDRLRFELTAAEFENERLRADLAAARNKALDEAVTCINSAGYYGVSLALGESQICDEQIEYMAACVEALKEQG